jgi:hypothetical protein
VKPDIENIRGIHLAVVKLTTVQVTNKLPLWNKIPKLGMICSVKTVLTDDLFVVQMEKISITCYMCETYT